MIPKDVTLLDYIITSTPGCRVTTWKEETGEYWVKIEKDDIVGQAGGFTIQGAMERAFQFYMKEHTDTIIGRFKQEVEHA